MIPEIGNFALIVALVLALTQGVLPIWGAARGNAVLMNAARPLAFGQFVFVAIAFTCLVQSFLLNDFSVLYVAEHSNSQLPAYFRFAAVLGGHEGSLLLWAFILTIWTIAVAMFSKHLPEEMVARVLGVMGLISVGFLLFMLLVEAKLPAMLADALSFWVLAYFTMALKRVYGGTWIETLGRGSAIFGLYFAIIFVMNLLLVFFLLAF